mgnify:CR=1 FL=1
MIAIKKMNNQKLWLLAVIAFFVCSCKFTEPTIGDFNLQNFTPQSGSKYLIEVAVDVDNPNTFNIWLKKGNFDIILGKEKVGKIKTIGKVTLKKQKHEIYTIKGEAEIDPNSPLMEMILNGGKGKRVTIKGTLKGGVFIFGKKFEVEFDDNLPSMSMFN